MNDKKVFYNLQICRGLAALIVVLAHTNLIDKNLFSGFLIIGWNGVDFFFVLSGFIIYYVNYSYLGRPASYTTYLSKRLIRIFPIYWLYTFLVILVHLVKTKITGNPLVSWIDLDAAGIIKSFTLYPTRVADNEMPIIPVAWTLTFELLFYLLFGFAILTRKKVLLFIGALWLIGIAIVSFSVVEVADNTLLVTIFNPKNLEFMYGCLIAELALKRRTIGNRLLSQAVLIAGIILLMISWTNEALELRLLPKMDSLTFGVPYALIIYALVSMEISKIGGPFKKALVYLGDASYSVYLTHYIGITLLRNPLHKVFNNGYIEFFILVTSLTIFGCLCYKFVEKPLLDFINSKNKKSLLTTERVR
ncbi:acyltransferase [Dyadobacter sp. CY323]|uniref:acyltransferase family protein n=1 Tax=Dyadobacter sp. CY323 TaxID=2907302 RepID=UPI001F3BA687|nr:acyltransferase [Dyadobacter sp. CY323]MCE6991697.1 acyltransferase [Dyadobacter sp. CY323]